MGYDSFYNNWNKIFSSPAFTAINDLQKYSQNISHLVNPPAFAAMNELQKNMQVITDLVNSPAGLIIKDQRSLWDSALSFNNALKVADIATLQNQALYKNPFTQNQLLEIKNILEPSKSLFSAIISDNSILNAFNNSGIFSTISSISKNMSAITAISKLNSLASILEPFDYVVKFSNDNDILVNDEILSEDDIMDFAKEFEELPLGISNTQVIIVKLKNKKGNFFLYILWVILFNLLFSPLVGDFFSAIRDITGISKILEKIDVKGWVDELWKNNSGEIILDNLYVDKQEDNEKTNLPDMEEE